MFVLYDVIIVHIYLIKIGYFNPFSAATVFMRQILTYKIDFRTERIKLFTLVVDPYHRYSNEAERAKKYIYHNIKLKKIFWFLWFIHTISTLQWLIHCQVEIAAAIHSLQSVSKC